MATLRFLALLFSCFYFCVRCQGQRFSDLKNMAANQKGGIVTVGNEFKDQAGEKFKERTEEVKSSLHGLFDPVGSPGKSAFFQKVKKDGIDSVELFETLFKSKAFESILENVEIQHRIIEGVPILGAVSGFREARGRRLTDQETTAGFSKGVRNLLEMFKTSAKHALNPTLMNERIAELSKSDDPEIQDLFKGASENDEASVLELKNLAARDLYPGVDLEILQDVMNSLTFDKLLDIPEMARFIDQDPYISRVFRMNQ